VAKTCASPVGIRTECAVENSNWSTFSDSTESICVLSETILNPGQAFRLTNNVYHRTDRQTAGGGTAILVRRGITHPQIPVTGVNQLEATVIQVVLAGRPVKILAVYLTIPLTDRRGAGRMPWRRVAA
jgi:hypothetical protein